MIAFKMTAAVLVLLAGFAGGMIATRFSRSGSAFAGLANTFAGGVFLGAALLHMLPDAIAQFQQFAPNEDYPVFSLIIAIGFLFVLLLDKVMVSSRHGLGGGGAVYPYILMLTLSIHSVITGIAMGLEDKIVSASAILLAIMAHKSTAAMALTVSFEQEHIPSHMERNLLLIFYFSTPLGIVFGTWWASLIEGPDEAIVEGLFDALAAGTFFYIAVMDLFAAEFSCQENLWKRFGVAVLGLCIMAVVAAWT